MRPDLVRPTTQSGDGSNVVTLTTSHNPNNLRQPITGGGGDDPPIPPSVSELRRTKHNEQTKLRATGLNTVGVGFIVAGLITPLTGLGVGAVPFPVDPGRAGVLMLIWIISALILHFGATLTLEALE